MGIILTALLTVLLSLWSNPTWAQFADPFAPEVELQANAEGYAFLAVSFTVPEHHYLYADTIRAEAEGPGRLEPLSIPEGKRKLDPFTAEERDLYLEGFTATWRVLLPEGGTSLTVTVSYQGCDETLCYAPARKTYMLSLPDDARARLLSVTPQAEIPPGNKIGDEDATPESAWEDLAGGFRVMGYLAGFVKPEPFLEFIDGARTGEEEAGGLAGRIGRAGLLASLLLILVGGILLNLTPCVLPMIPINIAIIGAGAQAGSRLRGFLLGGAYGLGIAFTYGVLGLLVVLLPAFRFGTLNSAPWFNFTIAVLFVLLGLAMLGVFNIDFTRFRSGTPGGPSRRGKFFLALFMGSVAALLAGACVAPVVIAVLVLAGDLYTEGHRAALALPLMLGVGMGLPWPFAGAGLSFLPKPGRWMTWVKIAFAVFIFVMAGYYGWTGLKLAKGRASDAEAVQLARAQEEQVSEGDWHDSLPKALEQARRQNKAVFIDFWATWCKNCLVMNRVTFSDPSVQSALEPFVKVKIQAERFDDPAT
ncbi:thioredoxin family protein, partial [bacterium]|nr:thioredoxin family protein [bacterium]